VSVKRMSEVAIRLSKAKEAATSEAAVIAKSTLSPEDWDQVVLAGCCTQGCCGDPGREANTIF
jgi:hypothetical protein